MRKLQGRMLTGSIVAGLACVVLAACGRGEDPAEVARKQQAAQAAEAAFAASQQAWREQRRAALLRPDGWTSLIGLHWIEPGAHYLGSDADNGIRLAMGPSHLGMLERRHGQLRFVPERGVALLADGKPLHGSTTLQTDADPDGPTLIGFDGGNGLASVIKRGDRYALRVKHANAPTRAAFGTLGYWPGGAGWRIDGQFIAHPAGKTIDIVNIVGTTEAVPNPGAIEFQRDGKPYRLEALDQGDDTLFLIYADRTSGHGSYGAGRYLDAPRPDAQGRVVLDFNQGHNPPCAFTAFATCPLPPPENRLDLAIAAGEKAYVKPAATKE
jgi:uncharacterized protein (DUF1684 family)